MSELSAPWSRPDASEGRRLAVEAAREIKSGHQLHGLTLTTVAQCSGCDDVVFACDDGTFAVVHLSWQSDERPPWPDTTRIGSFLGIELAMDQHEH